MKPTPPGTDPEYKSRTRKKKEDRALQRLGEALVALPSARLAAMDLPDELREAVEFARSISKHGARRRQIKYIGALLRHIDPQPIQIALEHLKQANLEK
jgi:ribosome-associated protein